jgi:hypothetical protein
VRSKTPLIERLWTNSETRGECRVWTGARMLSGAPRIGLREGAAVRQRDARAVMYELANDCKLPPRTHVAVTCGQVTCIRPEHLRAPAIEMEWEYVWVRCCACDKRVGILAALRAGYRCRGCGSPVQDDASVVVEPAPSVKYETTGKEAQRGSYAA